MKTRCTVTLVAIVFVGLFASVSARDSEFDLEFDSSRRANAIKAWGARVCAFEFENYRLRCFDPDGVELFSSDVRESVQGGFDDLSKVVDYAILDDGSVAVVGYAFERSPEAFGEGFVYLLQLDSAGRAVGFHKLRDVDPMAFGGTRSENLVLLGRGVDGEDGWLYWALAFPKDKSSEAAVPWPAQPEDRDALRSALGLGIAVDGAGNRFFWTSGDTLTMIDPSGRRRDVGLPKSPDRFQAALSLSPRAGAGALAVVMEGENEASAAAAALGQFVLRNPKILLYAVDDQGVARPAALDESVSGVAGELADGRLVIVKSAGSGGRVRVSLVEPHPLGATGQ